MPISLCNVCGCSMAMFNGSVDYSQRLYRPQSQNYLLSGLLRNFAHPWSIGLMQSLSKCQTFLFIVVSVLLNPGLYLLWTLLWSCSCLVAQLCLTLCDPMDCSPPGSSVHGISKTRVLGWDLNIPVYWPCKIWVNIYPQHFNYNFSNPEVLKILVICYKILFQNGIFPTRRVGNAVFSESSHICTTLPPFAFVLEVVWAECRAPSCSFSPCSCGSVPSWHSGCLSYSSAFCLHLAGLDHEALLS